MANDFTVEAWLWIDRLEPYNKVISITGYDGKNLVGWGLGTSRRRNKDGTKNPPGLYFSVYSVWDVNFLFLPARRSRTAGSTWPSSTIAPTRPISI